MNTRLHFTKEYDEEFIYEVEENGYSLFNESYFGEDGHSIQVIIYEYESRTYLFKYVNEERVTFKDITARR